MFKKSLVRQSNIELLRIFSMVLIVFHHIGIHSGLEVSDNPYVINQLWILLLQNGGKIGVDIFVLISGYFLINSTGWKLNKIFKLWMQVFVYSFIGFIVWMIVNRQPIGISTILEYIFPITFKGWWFASTYFMLLLLSPLINKMLLSLDKKTYFRVLIFFFGCWSVIPTVLNLQLQSNELLWFVFLYSVSGYIRLHIGKIKIKSIYSLMISGILTVLLILAKFVVIYTGVSGFVANMIQMWGVMMHSVPCFLIALFIFLAFLNSDIRSKPIINIVASTTFGIYLIHDSNLMRPWLWKECFKIADFETNAYFVPYTIAVATAVFVCCAVIELVRQYTLERMYMPLVGKVEKIIRAIDKKLFEKF